MLVILSEGLIDTDEILYTLPKLKDLGRIKVVFKNAQYINLAPDITNEEFVMMMKHIHNLTDKTATIVDLDIFLRQRRKAAEARRKAKEAKADFHPPQAVGADRPSTHTHGGTDAPECRTCT